MDKYQRWAQSGLSQSDSVRAGDTFFVNQPYDHLYVVCSDPAADSTQVLLVSVTSWKPREESCCILAAGDHPSVPHKSCIRYKDARIASVGELTKLLEGPLMARRAPVSVELLARIRKGASESEYLPEKCRKILRQQCLI